MSKLVQAPTRRVYSRVYDSARWNGWKARSDDIIIATYAKVGTTWTQRIVSLLVFQTPDPLDLRLVSPWPDARPFMPVEAMREAAESDDPPPLHQGAPAVRRPADPRGGEDDPRRPGRRDAALSLHNHLANFTPKILAQFDERLMADPRFRAPFPRFSDDAAEFFHLWLTDGDTDGDGDEGASFFHVENSWWAVRDDPNVLMVHYADLKADLEGEMRRIAAFLDIDVPEALWPSLVEAASFGSMRREVETNGGFDAVFNGGAARFFNKGVNGRWQGLFADADLALYDARVRQAF